MGNKEGKESTIQKEKLSFIEEIGQKEVQDSEKNMFNLSEYGGIKEANALIERYKLFTTLTDEDEKILRENVPAPPSFTIVPKEEYDNKFNCNKNRYKKKVKKYFKNREESYKKKAKKGQQKSRGQIYAEKRAQIEKKIMETSPYFHTDNEDKLIESESLLKKARDNGYYPDIEQLAREENRDLTEVMDEQYQKLSTDKQFEKYELEIGKNEYMMQSQGKGKFRMGVTEWTGYRCQQYKAAMWSGEYSETFEYVKEKMTERPLNRDVIVRRGQKSFKGLANALGFSNPDRATPDQIKEKLQQRIDDGGELILTEKAMMSTAFPFAKSNYSAGTVGGRGEEDDPRELGIEYIILAKKGTAAANVIYGAMKKDESELLISQRTKFRIIKAELDGNANILHGNKHSWKIYMVTVPESENGLKYNERESA